MSVWGVTRMISATTCFPADYHAFLDRLDEAQARIFAAEQGYDLVVDDGMLMDWWGYCWTILAEKTRPADAGKPRRRRAESRRRFCRRPT